ncbi:hypothetical protein AB0F43_05950 [Kribbella sp. NPDC023972]
MSRLACADRDSCDFDVPEYAKGVLWAVNNPFIGNSAGTTIWTSII